jgi:hypothetical protein
MAGFDYDVLISPVVPAGARGELRLEAKQSGDGRRMRTAPPTRRRFRQLPLQKDLKT